jgi:hypothetical protein
VNYKINYYKSGKFTYFKSEDAVMYKKNMIIKTIVDSYAFLDMPQQSQLLYFHLAIRADDGFVNNPKSIISKVRCSNVDLEILSAKGFIQIFEYGLLIKI